MTLIVGIPVWIYLSIRRLEKQEARWMNSGDKCCISLIFLTFLELCAFCWLWGHGDIHFIRLGDIQFFRLFPY